jgi:hypothetical protein
MIPIQTQRDVMRVKSALQRLRDAEKALTLVNCTSSALRCRADRARLEKALERENEFRTYVIPSREPVT